MIEWLLVIQIALGLQFLVSACAKLADPFGFADGVARYDVLPSSFVRPFAASVIGIECALSVCHLLGIRTVLAAGAGGLLMGMFATAVGVVLARGDSIPCYCLGAQSSEMVSTVTLVRLDVLIAAEVILVSAPPSAAQLLRSGPADERVLVLSAAALIMVGFSWMMSVPDLRWLWGTKVV